MVQRRHHYERAFESYLRLRAVPYVAVDEAKRAIMGDVGGAGGGGGGGGGGGAGGGSGSLGRVGGRPLKSFDFVVYGSGGPAATGLAPSLGWSGGGARGGGGAGDGGGGENLLVELKGRKISRRVMSTRTPDGRVVSLPRTRLESWVTLDDIESLRAWESLFGAGFVSVIVFVYWCDEQPPDALFQEVMDFQGRWYALRAVRVGDYASAMKTRSAKWRTVDLPSDAFERLSQPLGPAWLGSVG